jgi:hypothetical protein
MITVKLHLNSVISTKNALYCTIDLKDFYLNTLMDQPEYMHMKISNPLPIFSKPTTSMTWLLTTVQSTSTYRRACTVSHKWASLHRISSKNDSTNTATIKATSHQAFGNMTGGLTLCVDNFGIKYVGQEHDNHLAKILKEHYKCSIDWDGRYCGMNMEWDYNGRKVHISLLDYVPKALTCFQHQAPRKPQHQPYPHLKPNYGAKAQYTEVTDTLVLLPKEDKKFIQEVIGTFLYYARCDNSAMLAALGSTATQQANPTKNTMKKVHIF